MATWPGHCGVGTEAEIRRLVADGVTEGEILAGVSRVMADWSPKAQRAAKAERFLASGDWRDIGGKPPVGGVSHTGGWLGPAEIRAAVVKEKRDSFAVSYLDRAAWTPGPEPGSLVGASITTARATAATELDKLDCLRDMGIHIFDGSERRTG